RVKKTVYLPSIREKQLTRADMAFCTRCVVNSANASSLRFAALDAAAEKGNSVRYVDLLRF
ncbi:hypothetical protein Gpo141_00014922, partial [Globisporangium polare]